MVNFPQVAKEAASLGIEVHEILFFREFRLQKSFKVSMINLLK
jgi:hypothetical protein